MYSAVISRKLTTTRISPCCPVDEATFFFFFCPSFPQLAQRVYNKHSLVCTPPPASHAHINTTGYLVQPSSKIIPPWLQTFHYEAWVALPIRDGKRTHWLCGCEQVQNCAWRLPFVPSIHYLTAPSPAWAGSVYRGGSTYHKLIIVIMHSR